MNQSGIRESSKPFVDGKLYPRGFRKSGDFSIAESDILTQFGSTLKLLASGEMTAESSEEQQFVAVICGNARPTTKIEKAWMKYSQLSNYPRRFYTMNSRKLAQIDYSAEQDEAEELEID